MWRIIVEGHKDILEKPALIFLVKTQSLNTILLNLLLTKIHKSTPIVQ
jgi:hypothetical protein